jgi:3-hydroxyisobutyrate dehydrogenase-like beta-hydroxyacid dehydrogenase
MMKKTGMIGLGLMGGSICRHLLSKGYEITVCDLNPAKAEALGKGAVKVDTPKEVFRKSEVVLLSLPDSSIIEEVMEQAFSENLSGKTVIDLSTAYPLSTRKLAERMAAAGGAYIDAPLLAGPDEAAKGELIAMVAGDRKAVDAQDLLLRDFCIRTDYVGASGTAHTIKILMNFTGLMYALILGQMFPLAEKMGVDPDNLYHLMDNEIFSNWIYRFYAPKMIHRTFDMAFSLKLGHKDLSYMKKLYDEFNVPAFALDGGLDLLRNGIKDGKGALDFSRCSEIMAEYLKLDSASDEKK